MNVTALPVLTLNNGADKLRTSTPGRSRLNELEIILDPWCIFSLLCIKKWLVLHLWFYKRYGVGRVKAHVVGALVRGQTSIYKVPKISHYPALRWPNVQGQSSFLTSWKTKRQHCGIGTIVKKTVKAGTGVVEGEKDGGGGATGHLRRKEKWSKWAKKQTFEKVENGFQWGQRGAAVDWKTFSVRISRQRGRFWSHLIYDGRAV